MPDSNRGDVTSYGIIIVIKTLFIANMYLDTLAQMCKDQGASIEAVSRARRHRTAKTTEISYARIRPEDAFREIEEALDRPRRARKVASSSIVAD